ncbi:BAG6 [Lepeophtheirus salmonis]|uniref:BAG6 n=1 Tax=Lepeophtheirus salmonis TaxID=72036 RepID=A0A7R8CFV8_LEPSM|nr:BAG6 [Lepeophtheirus salmonis]CAF2804835.1 BAG6 [Lepeophtheirus salmonis]
MLDMKKTLQKELSRSNSNHHHSNELDLFSLHRSSGSTPSFPVHGGSDAHFLNGSATTRHRKDSSSSSIDIPITDVNIQYLKRAIFKFFTGRDDEAFQMIKVISTILKFSKEESKLASHLIKIFKSLSDQLQLQLAHHTCDRTRIEVLRRVEVDRRTMSISVTIKTLDSRNHPFSGLDPEMTIRQLKEKISPNVDIPAERQRLIYFLHLVSRQPRSTNDGASRVGVGVFGPTLQNRPSNGPTPDVNITVHHAPPFRAAGGTNPVRAELPRSSATIRLQLASRMLRRANTIIDSLDNPGREESSTSTNGSAPSSSEQTSSTGSPTTTTSTSSASVVGGGGGDSSDLSSLFAFNGNGGETVIGTMAIQIETNGNNTPSAAVIVQNDGLAPLQRIFQRLEQQNHLQGETETTPNTVTSTSSSLTNDSATAPSATPNSSNGSSSGNSTTAGGAAAATTTTTTSNSSSRTTSSNEQTGGSTTIEHPPPNALAEVMEEYNRTNSRLAPYTERMINLLRTDPELSENVHAMSDILFNLSTPTPRVIRARPFLLHRPAFQNVAISATATPATRATQQRTSTTTATPSSASTNGGKAQPIIVGIPNVRQGNNRGAFMASETDFISNMIRATLLGGIQNAAAAAVSGNTQTANNTSSSSLGGSTPPAASAASLSSTANSNNVNTNGSSTSGTSSQRSSDMNSGTQPTTSTRTRSSPHVHYAATPMKGQSGGMPAGVSGRWSTFDHHPIRRRTRHPAGFQIHHGAQQRSSSVPPHSSANNASPSSTASSASTKTLKRGETGTENPSTANNTQASTNNRQERESGETPDLRRMALAQGIRDLFFNQVINVNAPPNNTAVPQYNDDQVMFNIIQGILRYFVGALDLQAAEGNSSVNTVSTGNETMEQFLRSLPDYNYVEGESVITDLLMTIIRHLTFRDLVTWIFGGGDRIINQFREPLANFVRGQLSQSDNIEESVQGFLDSYYPQVEEISNLASVSPDIDFAETLHNFMSERLVTLVQIVLRQDNLDSFGRDISRQVSNLFVGLTALGMHSFTDGPASIERVVQSQLGALCGHGLGPVARDQLMSIATGHLRNYIGGLGANSQEDVSRYIIKKGQDADRRKSERNKRISKQSENNQDNTTEEERFETPPSSPERMEVEEEIPKSNLAEMSVDKESSPENVLPIDPNQKFPSELLKMAQGPDMVIGSETWHKSLPTEWVPIITRDISRQQRSSNPRKSTLPSSSSNATPSTSRPSNFVDKKEKAHCFKEPDRGADLENVIAESLNEALSETGVVTLVDVDQIAASPDVVQSVEVKTKSVIKDKLSKDVDFANSPEGRFSSSKAFSASSSLSKD